jgi:hypothetical protein
MQRCRWPARHATGARLRHTTLTVVEEMTLGRGLSHDTHLPDYLDTSV